MHGCASGSARLTACIVIVGKSTCTPVGPAAPAVDDVKRGRHTQIVHDIRTEHEDREKAQRKWQEREAIGRGLPWPAPVGVDLVGSVVTDCETLVNHIL